jgi:hypothetical protein
MRAQVLCIGLVVLLSATACSSPPHAASRTAAEIAALEKQVGSTDHASPEADVPAKPKSNVTFARRADDAARFLAERLPKGSAARDQSRFDADLATVRKMVAEVRANAHTPAEQSVGLLLTTMFVKDKERHQTALLAPLSRVDMSAEIQQLEEESAVCRSEFDDWMKAVRGEVDVLELGPCLQRARAAAAFLSQP